ncbi:hypothetical protein OPQ81_009004 [Rhizoctonia solani]|nr:hypothetical protein OPQ81_009004 [Rhizoctonia solani]
MVRPLSNETLNKVLSLIDSKHTHSQITCTTGVSSAYITKVAAKHQPHLERSKGSRPQKLNPTTTHYVVHLLTNGSKVSMKQATQKLCELTGQSIATETVRRALKEVGLQAVKKVRKPKLTPRHIWERLLFAQAHKDWTVADWQWVLWSDETKINRLWSDGVHWAWAQPGEGISDWLTIPTTNHGGGSLMFWGCMGWLGTGHGTKIEASLTKEVYVEILEDEFLQSLEHLGMEQDEVIYMHDNASTHKAKIVVKWLEDHGIKCLEWPANSPDLNPIENLWAELKRHLGEYEEPPNGMLELWDRVQAVWNEFGQDYCQSLIESMPERMAMVLEKKGKPIPY